MSEKEAATTRPEELESHGKLLNGRYRCLERLGAGGMGIVYRAYDAVQQRELALKQLRAAELPAQRRALVETLFAREYHTLVRLRHPRIIEVYEYGHSADGPFYTMELLSGQDLQTLAPLPYRELCGHLRDVASSLALLHAHGLAHRDVSPRNVRRTADGRTKLIDFGALAPFGVNSDVVGTPICIAPEVLRRMPIDQRADLYALGVVAYMALTGRPPYVARRLDDLPQAWKLAPAPASTYAPDVPAALDALLGSLLSVNVLARPSSAAAVIEALTQIADLPSDASEKAADSYLASGRMVGRTTEETWFAKRTARILEGTGSQVLIAGAAGLGKTRLLHELSLQAQLAGVLCVKADGQASPEPFGVAMQLARELLVVAPEIARRCAQPQAQLLAQLSEGLREQLGAPAPVELASDPAERRARFLNALQEWFLGVARAQPLVVAVDNLHDVDHNSAALLASLAHASTEAPLIVLCTLRTGEPVVSSDTLRALRKNAVRLKLGALTQPDCEQLVGSLFGDVPNARRLASLLYQRSAGNPRQCVELAGLLVRKGIAKYAGGTWVLPFDIASDELPAGIDALVAARLAELTGTARDLVETLSVDGAPVSIERCRALSPGRSAAEVFDALAELVAEHILEVDAERYRFRQQGLRQAVLAQLADPRRRQLHQSIAQDLLARTPEFSQQVRAAWHLVQAGEEARGADLIVAAGTRYLTDEAAYDSTAQVVEALQKALEIYERQGRSEYQIAAALLPLVPLGFFSDWRVVRDHSERTLVLGLKITGLTRAAWLARVLGPKLGLTLALTHAHLRMRLSREPLPYDVRSAIRRLCAAAPSAVGSAAVFFDHAAVARMQRHLLPLSLLGRPDQIPNLIYRFVQFQHLIIQDRFQQTIDAAAALAPCFRRPEIVQAIGDGQSRGIYGGVLYLLSLTSCYLFGRRALELADELQTLRIEVWEAAAEQARLLYHANRGELEQVQRCRERVELFAMRGASTWQVEIFLPALLVDSDYLTQDTVAARRNAELLARRAEHIPTLAPFADLAQASYLSLRGDLPGAIALFDRLLPDFEPYEQLSWLALRGFLADTLNRAGQHERAKQLTSRALEQIEPREFGVAMRWLEVARQLALAELGLGAHASAAARLDALLAQHGHEDNHLFSGLLHKARAEVALAMHDDAALTTHFGEFERRFRSTRNPALIAQVERLASRVGRALPPNAEAPVALSVSLTEFANVGDRYRHALQLVLQRAQAKAGYLYVLHGDELRLVASSSPQEAPLGLETQLRESTRLLRQQPSPVAANDADEIETALVEVAAAQALPVDDFSILMLASHRQYPPIIVGGLILQQGKPAALEAGFLEELASALANRAINSTAF